MQAKPAKRTSKSASIYITVASLLIIALTISGLSVFLKAYRFEVTGNRIYTKEMIVSASGISTGKHSIFTDKKSMAASILSALPYISEVTIELKLPDMVRINVTESAAIAVIVQPEYALVLDSNGRILEKEETVPGSLIEVRGFIPSEVQAGSVMKPSAGDERRLQQLVEALKAIEEENAEKEVKYIDVTNLAHFMIGFGPRFTADFGVADNIRYKLTRLPGIIKDLEVSIPEYETGIINMSEREPWRWVPDR